MQVLSLLVYPGLQLDKHFPSTSTKGETQAVQEDSSHDAHPFGQGKHSGYRCCTLIIPFPNLNFLLLTSTNAGDGSTDLRTVPLGHFSTHWVSGSPDKMNPTLHSRHLLGLRLLHLTQLPAPQGLQLFSVSR